MGNCMCNEAGLLIFSCSGGSDVGELSDKVARKMAKCGQAKMFCLAGIGAHIPGVIESTKQPVRLSLLTVARLLAQRRHWSRPVSKLWRLILKIWVLRRIRLKLMRRASKK